MATFILCIACGIVNSITGWINGDKVSLFLGAILSGVSAAYLSIELGWVHI